MSSTVTPQQSAQHGAGAHTDGGWDAEDRRVPVQTRSERTKGTTPDAFEPVTGREVDWKFTPVERIRDLIDGELDGSPYAVQYPEAAGTDVEWIPRDHESLGRAGIPEDRAAANAWASFEQALRIGVEGEAEHITVTRAHLGATPRAAHVLIEAAPGSSGLVVLDSRGAARLAENVEIVVGAGADLTVVSVQEWDDDAVHLGSHFARVERDGVLKHILVSLGGSIVRVNPQTHLAGEGGDVEMLGLYFADAAQHLEQQVYVNHDAPHTRSRVTYKGALNGQGAHSVWIGDVLIGRAATGTDSYEQNRNLVLSDGTRADSIPNLEIETGDIAGAGHASATGRFDDEQLFYLRARGIPEDEARRLVVLGFLSEVVQRIGEPKLEERLHAALVAELEAAR